MAKEQKVTAAPGQTVVVVKEKKSLLAKIFGFGCLGIVVIIIIVAIASSKGGSSTSSSSGSSSGSSQQKSEYSVGEEIKQDGMALTVTDVQRNYSTGNEFDNPEAGKELVRVNVKLVNSSGSTKSYNEFDFKIQTSTGNRLDSGFSTVPNSLNSGDLVSGGSVVGNIVFTVPKDDKGLKLIYDGSLWSNEVVVKL